VTPDLIKAALPPVSDRLLTTCFLALLLHGILILGITFSPPRAAGGDGPPALEVILVNDQVPAAQDNHNARYLAERSQHGSGNTPRDERALIPKSSALALDRLGVASGDGVAAQHDAAGEGDEEMLTTRWPAVRIQYFAGPQVPHDTPQLPLLLEKKPDLGMTPNDDGVALRLRGETKDQLWISADTRQSDLAVYLDAWRRKVERVGTMNFPDAARRVKLSGTPVLEVTVAADGRLTDAVVRRSSGHPEIDEAAIRILRLAAPFEPFPRELGATHDEMRIAYEWQFLDGAAQGPGVFIAAPEAVDP
jgi:protein TonB